MQRQSTLIRLCTIGFVLAVFSAGCSRGPERVVISGTVTYRGQPIPGGSISFYPSKTTGGAPAIVAISDGKYSVNSQGGLLIGDYSVVILATRVLSTHVKPEARPGNPFSAGETEGKQYLPPKYNDQTQLEVVIEPGRATVIHDFTLTD